MNNTNMMLNGNMVLLLYDFFVLCFFVMDFYFYRNKKNFIMEYEEKKTKGQKVRKCRLWFLRLMIFYYQHGLMVVNFLLFIVLIIVSAVCGTLSAFYFLKMFVRLNLFFGIMAFIKKFFQNRGQFENIMVFRCVNGMFYLILGHLFVYHSLFISRPNLDFALVGLLVSLGLCFYVMLWAIIDPRILLRKTKKGVRRLNDAIGIIKGMIILIGCELLILYSMVFCCYNTDNHFYQVAGGRLLDSWDFVYYLITSFSTIGYGDIVPIRYNGDIHSILISIIIALSSLFTTGCFVGAVVASVYNSNDQQNHN